MMFQPGDISQLMQKFALDNAGEINDPVLPCMCVINRLEKPKIIATATDKYLKPKVYINDFDLLSRLRLGQGVSEAEKKVTIFPESYLFGYGQDLDHYECKANVPAGTSPAASSEADLKAKMLLLLNEFASRDKTNMSDRLFNSFLQKNSKVEYFEDSDLNSAAESHNNIKIFCDRVMSAPGLDNISEGKIRIHQALQGKGWDVNKVDRLTDLGVPAFNEDKWGKNDDWNNGLKVMINGVQHVVVIVEDYFYDQCKSEYYIKLRYLMYDVFGLDDEDVQEYGINGSWFGSNTAREGISAWWQLQHQYSYMPLITKINFCKEHIISV